MPNTEPRTSNPEPLYDVVGIGIAYTDIIAYVPQNFLREFSIPLEFARVFDEAGINVVKARLPDPEFFPCGLVANTVSGVAALGGGTAFFGKLGDDAEAELWREDFKKRGIAFACDPLSESIDGSPICIALLTPDQKRSYALYHGCGTAFSKKDFAGFDFTQSRFVMTNGSFLIGCANASLVQDTLDAAREKGCRAVISLSNVATWQGHETIARRASSYDIVIGNEAEMRAFYDATRYQITPGQIVVTTYGEQGASALSSDGVLHVPALAPEPFVSAVGAGDQFLAGLLRGLSLGYTLERSLYLGAHCATSVLSEIGARPTKSWENLLARVA